jgi:hypothetical protein
MGKISESSLDKIFNQSLDQQSRTQDLAVTSGSLAQQPQDWASLVEALRAQGAAEWQIKLIQVAQDMRQDIAPGTTELWKEKLWDYRDEEISSALVVYSGEFFPSAKDIKAIMDRARERRWEEKQAQPPKEEHGKVPATQADWDEMKRKAREIFAKADKSNDLQLAERNKKAQQQARVLGCESK